MTHAPLTMGSSSGKLDSNCTWIWNLKGAERSEFSQGGQGGIISAIFSHIGTRNKFYVEFGFGHHEISNKMDWKRLGLNTAYLRQGRWHGTYFDAIFRSEDLNTTQVVLTLETIV